MVACFVRFRGQGFTSSSGSFHISSAVTVIWMTFGNEFLSSLQPAPREMRMGWHAAFSDLRSRTTRRPWTEFDAAVSCRTSVWV